MYTNWPMLTEEHKLISTMAKNFAQTELVPIANTTDQKHLFPTEQIKKLGELGMMGLNVSPEFGGAGMDTLCYAIAMEEISKACASSGVIMSAHNSLYCGPVAKYGTDEQKHKFLTPW
jgi:butyryl-CoA dehydrogenase